MGKKDKEENDSGEREESHIIDLFSPDDDYDLPTEEMYCTVWKDEETVTMAINNTTIAIPIYDFLILGRLFGVIAQKLSEPICNDCIEQDIKATYLKLLRDAGLNMPVSDPEDEDESGNKNKGV